MIFCQLRSTNIGKKLPKLPWLPSQPAALPASAMPSTPLDSPSRSGQSSLADPLAAPLDSIRNQCEPGCCHSNCAPLVSSSRPPRVVMLDLAPARRSCGAPGLCSTTGRSSQTTSWATDFAPNGATKEVSRSLRKGSDRVCIFSCPGKAVQPFSDAGVGFARRTCGAFQMVPKSFLSLITIIFIELPSPSEPELSC